MEQNHFSTFGRGSPKEHGCEIILKWVHLSTKRYHLKLWRPFCSVEQNDFSNFGRGSPKKYFYEIILRLVHWSRRRCHLKVFLFLALAAILFSGAE